MSFTSLIKRYWVWLSIVLTLGTCANILALLVPKLSATLIDAGVSAKLFGGIAGLYALSLIAIAALIVSAAQIYASTYFSEKVARDLRAEVIAKFAAQSYSYVAHTTPGRLLAIATSDIDAIKNVIAQGLVGMFSAVITLSGAAVLLLSIQTKLALITMSVIPLLILSMGLIFGKLGKLFREGQENLERINAVINETIVGAALVRVLNSGKTEIQTFETTNSRAKEVGLLVVKNISALIPIITLLANVSTMLIVWFGGKLAVSGDLSIGDFSAFLSYSAMFIWPLFVLGFTGPMISRGAVSLKRIGDVLAAPTQTSTGTFEKIIEGKIEFKHVSLAFKDTSGAERYVLKDVSFVIQPRTKNAIVGPTAAGKTQLFYLMAGLAKPTAGEIYIDDVPLEQYQPEKLLQQLGLVFQDSIVFNTSLRENIALDGKTTDAALQKAIQTAELDELVKTLPQGLETFVSERGTSLSGGQKQRLMLARALAVEPKILLLDDFTARVDVRTEASILSLVAAGYKNTTLVSITQKIEPIKKYDQILVLMEGELLDTGTHEELLGRSLEYRQIFESQQSTDVKKTDAQ